MARTVGLYLALLSSLVIRAKGSSGNYLETNLAYKSPLEDHPQVRIMRFALCMQLTGNIQLKIDKQKIHD
jgi:hypothetical protein